MALYFQTRNAIPFLVALRLNMCDIAKGNDQITSEYIDII